LEKLQECNNTLSRDSFFIIIIIIIININIIIIIINEHTILSQKKDVNM